MAKKLVTRTEFARMAQVAPASVTKACNGRLQPATVGKRIDVGHPEAVAYLAKHDRARTPPAAPGLDPLYEEAFAACTEAGRWSITFVQKSLGVGFGRASSVVDQLKAAGLVPEPGKAPPPEPVATKPAHVRGTAAARERKKHEPPYQPPGRGEDYVLEVPEDIQAFADMTLRELIEKFGTDTRFVDWLKATQAIEAINEKRLKNAATRGELVSRKLIKTGVIDPLESAHIKLLTDGAKTIARRGTAMHDAGRSLEEIEKFVGEQITSFIRPVKSKVARALKNA